MNFGGQEEGERQNSAYNQKKLIGDVKECKLEHFRERVLLKKIIFVENALTYSTLRKKLEEVGVKTTRQYLYGIVSGRLTPSFSFATKLCEVLGIRNVYTIFDPTEIHLPDFGREK